MRGGLLLLTGGFKPALASQLSAIRSAKLSHPYLGLICFVNFFGQYFCIFFSELLPGCINRNQLLSSREGSQNEIDVAHFGFKVQSEEEQ